MTARSVHSRATAALVIAAAFVLGATAIPRQQTGEARPLSRADAERCQQKLDHITRNATRDRLDRAASRRTVLSEREMNAYLQFVLQAQLPAGLIETAAALAGQGQVGVRAVFDLDAVRGQRQRGVADPLRYLGGRVPMEMTCTLRSSDGQGTLEFGSATLNGMPVPQFVVQELVIYATRSADYPEGFRFDEPFKLPANIRELQVNAGEAVVIQ